MVHVVDVVGAGIETAAKDVLFTRNVLEVHKKLLREVFLLAVYPVTKLHIPAQVRLVTLAERTILVEYLLPHHTRNFQVDRGEVAASGGGELGVEGKGIFATFAKTELFSRQNIQNVAIVEGRIAFDAIAAFVFGIKQ